MKSRLCDYWTPSLRKILPCELSPDPATKGLRRDPGLCTWCMENLSVDLHVDSCEKAEEWIFHIRLFTFLNEEIKEKIWVEWGGTKKELMFLVLAVWIMQVQTFQVEHLSITKVLSWYVTFSYNWEFIYMSQEKTAPLIGRQGWKISVWHY